ncbi:hypothetical protein GUJ93_ZPchr0001g32112 [Zizania palustris]|uniref:Uncharacterized protein n=1 Tax=Zizania palustris TaxID=103762 RepID=A0A8J5RZS6_ZIZPA|nr:hypothetical protein GUJ93_ZPchr0001g32112 [Zizania palustris]
MGMAAVDSRLGTTVMGRGRAGRWGSVAMAAGQGSNGDEARRGDDSDGAPQDGDKAGRGGAATTSGHRGGGNDGAGRGGDSDKAP